MTTTTDDRTGTCPCGGELAFHGYTHTEKVGRWTLVDRTTLAWQCLACHAPRLSLDARQEYQLRAGKTALCDGKLDGGVIRYARKAMGLTQKELGLLLDYQHETLSRWENEKEAMPRAASVALVGLLCRAIDGEAPEDMLERTRQVEDRRAEVATTEIQVPAPARRKSA